MSKKNPEKRNRFTDKYRLTIYNDNNFEEVGIIRLSRMNLLAVIAILGLIFVGGVFSIISYTSVRELIPGYPDGTIRRNIILNALKVDSLEYQLKVRDQYINNIQALVSGRTPINYESEVDSVFSGGLLSFSRSIDDSMLREQIEQEERYNLTIFDEQPSQPQTFNSLHFFVPITGIITKSFSPNENHFGTDVVSGPNEVVKATLDGTVINTSWTLEYGYVIEIQHDNDLISIYKHNAEILKEIGAKVSAGESIAIIGNSGELTTGLHLHFELWHKGSPINPENYMVF